jgi:hypothetical protein
VGDSTIGVEDGSRTCGNHGSEASPLGDGDAEPEEYHRLFRNDVSRTVWKSFKAAISHKRAGFESDDEGEDEMECSILLLARLDAWIMTVVHCFGCEGKRGGQRQRIYIETFEKFLPIATSQLTKGIYQFVEKWEPEDLEVPDAQSSVLEGVFSTEGMLREVFSKTYNACVPVYVPGIKRTYIAVKTEWFMEYVGKELGHVKDCYIAEFDETYKELKAI